MQTRNAEKARRQHSPRGQRGQRGGEPTAQPFPAPSRQQFCDVTGPNRPPRLDRLAQIR